MNIIPGAKQQNYTPPAASRGIEYRRLVIENPLDTSINRNSASSNITRVLPLNNIINTICCNQIIEYGSTANPQPLTSAILNGSIYFQWQYSYDNVFWVDYFENSHSNNYSVIRNSRGSNPSYFRLMTLDYSTNLYNLSNVVRIIYNERPHKIRNIKDQNYETNNMIDKSILIYPNPSSSIINIKGIDNISLIKIKIIDLSGKTITSKKVNPSDKDLIQIDISSLPVGIYSLELENEISKFTKKIIKN
ncbi:T9SS type A sorting domain-containing protein [Flavobacterium soyangense]|uniref:T9SS type A sorting domain-containing protein n=1 Tax=Flavobacterium soyangense TaxID=2023265 RepID=A0A930XV26_9FLAO|nr:T9SS type A sorting domain-containing protein [Flavobacterium soyangense]MBF2707657.1 T9SS type A sorting domain-containing protein [Flavobacterium soyangense]